MGNIERESEICQWNAMFNQTWNNLLLPFGVVLNHIEGVACRRQCWSRMHHHGCYYEYHCRHHLNTDINSVFFPPVSPTPSIGRSVSLRRMDDGPRLLKLPSVIYSIFYSLLPDVRALLDSPDQRQFQQRRCTH